MKFTHIFLLFVFIATFHVVQGADDSIKVLQKQLKNKDEAVVYHATAELAAQYRRDDDLKKVAKLLKNFQTPSGFDRLPRKIAIPYLRCLLETAHLRALEKDVAGSLQLLNWATSRKNDYERAISCLKYAEILVDLNEPVRADAFLRDTDKIVSKHLAGNTGNGAAIGQGSKTLDTAVAWRNLRDQSEYIAAEVEELRLSKKFGSTYGLYVKLRRLQRIVKRSHRPRYFNEAMRLCDGIAETDPESQFAQAGGYLKGQILFSVIPDKAGKLQKTAIRDAKTYLNKFIKADPEGLYRGEAWMLLGKIALEKEWNAKHAEKCYARALAWFKAARTRRDALSLYAPLDNDLKNQTRATQRPTTLNKWKRTVYHEEDPLKLYNTASSPSWYISDKEKNCFFVLGFCKYLNEKYEEAGKLWEQAGKLDENIIKLEAANWPNILMRLKAVSRHGKMAFTKEEKKLIKSNRNKIRIQTAELYYMLEKFPKMKELFEDVFLDKLSSNEEKALALIGLGISNDMITIHRKLSAKMRLVKNFEQAIKLSKSELVRQDAMFRMACYLNCSSATKKQAGAVFQVILKKYPKGIYTERIMYKQGMNNLCPGKNYESQKILERMKRKFPEGEYTYFLAANIKRYKERLSNLNKIERIKE